MNADLYHKRRTSWAGMTDVSIWRLAGWKEISGLPRAELSQAESGQFGLRAAQSGEIVPIYLSGEGCVVAPHLLHNLFTSREGRDVYVATHGIRE